MTRMPDDRPPKQLLCGELWKGKHSVGGQKKRFMDTLRVSLEGFNVEVTSGETLARNCFTGSSSITAGAFPAEKQRIAEAERKRAASKGRVASTSVTPPPLPRIKNVVPYMCWRLLRPDWPPYQWSDSPCLRKKSVLLTACDGQTTTRRTYLF